tara:strand:+ start:889 stop:1620 length:732 start_codon:yes stop_codon:yes gene_type:complete
MIGDAKMKTPYRILKLRSGEQIIARLRGEERGKIIIERPMVFMTRFVVDPYSGRQRELTVLKNWLSHTNEIQTSLPKDYIATYLIPDTDVMELYSLEKEKEDIQPSNPSITNLTEMMKKDLDSDLPSMENMEPEEFENLMEMVRDAVHENPDLLEDLEEMEENTMSPKNRNFITMSMFLPPEALLSLVDAGLIDVEDVMDLIENLNGKVKRKDYTGDDEEKQKDKNFGNDWTDWSPDPNDYLR